MSDDAHRGGTPVSGASGDGDVPYRFKRSHAVGEVVEAFEGLEAGVETETVVSVFTRSGEPFS